MCCLIDNCRYLLPALSVGYGREYGLVLTCTFSAMPSKSSIRVVSGVSGVGKENSIEHTFSTSKHTK